MKLFLSHKIRQAPNFKDICAAQALIPMGLGLDWEFAFGPLCLDRNSLFQAVPQPPEQGPVPQDVTPDPAAPP